MSDALSRCPSVEGLLEPALAVRWVARWLSTNESACAFLQRLKACLWPCACGGMTVALSDTMLLCDMLRPLPDFTDSLATAETTHAFYTRRKPLSATINTLANALYQARLALMQNPSYGARLPQPLCDRALADITEHGNCSSGRMGKVPAHEMGLMNACQHYV